MSTQKDLEEALVGWIKLSTFWATQPPVIRGPLLLSEAEGHERYAAVRRTSTQGIRLGYGQIQWVDAYRVEAYWSSRIDRGIAQDEWEDLAMSCDYWARFSTPDAIDFGTFRDVAIDDAWEGNWLGYSGEFTFGRVA